jgi:exopolysaccharide biosynthesis polyprenyl glycosylphosphotransferase
VGRRIQPLSILLLLTDSVSVVIGLWLASLARSVIPFGTSGALPPSATALPWPFYAFASVVYVISLASAGAYDPHLALRWFNEAWRVVAGSVGATVILAGALYLSFRQTSRLQFFYFFTFTVVMLLWYRAALRIYYRLIGRARPGGRSRILILGAGGLGQRVASVLLDHSRWGYHPIGFLDDDPEKRGVRYHGLPVIDRIDQLGTIAVAHHVDQVWVALPNSATDRLGDLMNQVETLPLRIKVVPDYGSYAQIRTKSEVLADLPVIGLRDPLLEGIPRLAKRVFDVLVASVLAILCMPVMAVLWIAIRLDSKGPALIRQERIGENGRRFNMLKFRSMAEGASDLPAADVAGSEGNDLIHKRPDDPRVTRVGHFLRRFSLDELPQLFNVIRGDMSLVGPRPEMPWLVDRYESWQRKRFAVPQGLTGWWQINGRSDRPMHLHTEDDLYYVYNYSLWLDVKILLLTPWAVIRGEGAF